MNIWPYTLRAGHSDNPSGGACAMDAVNWLIHGKHGDQPECACPVIASFVRSGNDAMPDVVRQRLLPYLHRIAGSRSIEHEAARLRVLWLASVRVFTPIALDEVGLHSQANILRELHDDVSVEDAASAASAAAAAAEENSAASEAAAKAADSAANTAAWAADSAVEVAATSAARKAAWAATAAADAAVWAATAAADAAADAAVWAARTSSKAGSVWDAYFAVLDEALNAGPQGEPWSADTLRSGVGLYQAVGGLVTA